MCLFVHSDRKSSKSLCIQAGNLKSSPAIICSAPRPSPPCGYVLYSINSIFITQGMLSVSVASHSLASPSQQYLVVGRALCCFCRETKVVLKIINHSDTKKAAILSIYFMSNNPLNRHALGQRHTFASATSAILLSEVCLALKKRWEKIEKTGQTNKTEVMYSLSKQSQVFLPSLNKLQLERNFHEGPGIICEGA